MLSIIRKQRDNAAVSTVQAGEGASSQGNRIGPYRLCLELAQGGMSVVYLACADGIQGVAALKLIKSELASDPSFIHMFMDEAEVASRIRHANVCSVFDYDTSDGQYYIAMEYIVGESAGAIRRKIARLEPGDPERLARRVARMISDVCEGLHAAHELTDAEGEPLNVVHRDISPENLFLSYDGIAKVVDFGLVSASGQRHHTRTGILKGKMAYIAPECMQGKKADRRVDVWGAGVVAWELLTGTRLFVRNEDFESLRAVMDGPIPRPSEIRPGLPPEIDEVVMRALQRDPDLRYRTAQELGRDLLRIATSGSEVVSTGDLRDWMAELFPGGKERRRGLIELARQIDATPEDAPPHRLEHNNPSARPPKIETAVDQEAATVLRSREPERTSASGATPVDVSRSPSVPGIQRARGGRFGWPMIAASMIGAIVGAGVAVGTGLIRDWYPRHSAPSAGAPAPQHTTAPTRTEQNSPGTAQPTPAGSTKTFVVNGPKILELEGTVDELVVRIRPRER